MDGIKFVYFDIGGTIAKDMSGTEKWDEMLVGWGIPEERKEELYGKFREIEIETCKGNKNIDEFLEILVTDFGVKIPAGYSVYMAIVDNFSKNESIWKIVSECQKKCKIGLLTNMYPGWFDILKSRALIPELNWEVIVDSSKEGCKKPEKMIYEIAEKRCGYKGEEILFVDNLRVNIEAAKEMGWKTFFYDSNDYEKSSRELEEFLTKIFLI